VEKQKPINANIILGNILSTNAVFVERQVLLDNPFNEDRELSSLEDWELWIRLASRFQFFDVSSVTSVIVQHDQRSVMSTDIPKITAKVDVFCRYVTSDENNRLRYGERLRIATASAKTYAALHIAMARSAKGMVLKYLRSGLSDSTSQLFSKRFIVIVLFLLGLKR
jgi:hypothetical protein